MSCDPGEFPSSSAVSTRSATQDASVDFGRTAARVCIALTTLLCMTVGKAGGENDDDDDAISRSAFLASSAHLAASITVSSRASVAVVG